MLHWVMRMVDLQKDAEELRSDVNFLARCIGRALYSLSFYTALDDESRDRLKAIIAREEPVGRGEPESLPYVHIDDNM